MKKFKHIVFAGTFDRLHIGHKRLLDKAFKLAEKVSIGITTEKLYKSKPLADLISTSQVRKGAVEQYLHKRNWLKRARFFKLEDIFGPSTEFTVSKVELLRIKPAFDSILVTELTKKNAERINEIRKKKGLPLLKIIVAPLVRGDDGEIVTSERIRMGEIDREGHNFQILNPTNQKNPKSQLPKKILTLPKYLRNELRKPLGIVVSGSEEKIEATAKKTLQYINKLKSVMIISVGDIVTMSMLKIGFDPDVKIIDLRSRRKEIEFVDSATQFLSHESLTARQARGPLGSEKIAFASSNNFSKKVSKNFSSPFYFLNDPGSINIKAAQKIKLAIEEFIYNKKKQLIIVKGEEDLLALPAILFAPLKSVVLYGQIDLGVVMVEVTEEKKKEVAEILKKFS